MAVSGIGLSWQDATASADSGDVRIGAGTSTGTMYVRFGTQVLKSSYEDDGGHEHVTCEQRYVDVAVSARCVPRGDAATNGYGAWLATAAGATKWWWRRFKVGDSDLRHSEQDEFGPGVTWSVPLGFVSTDPTTSGTTILSALVSSDWSFSARRHDEIQLHVKVKTLYAEEGWVEDQGDPYAGLVASPVSEEDVYVGYRPAYACTGAQVTADGLAIAYSSPDWARSTDRFCVEELVQDGSSLVGPGPRPWGVVSAAGRLVVPMSALRRVPSASALTGRVRFNACWRPADMEFAAMGVSVTPTSASGVRRPSLSLSVSGSSVVATASDPGGSGLALDSVTVKLRGSSLSCDQATVAPGTPVTFRGLAPGDVTVDAVGRAANGQPSAGRDATATVSSAARWTTLVAAGGDYAAVQARWNVTESWDDAPEASRVKLAGRERESVFYGEGGAATGTLEFDILDADGGPVARQAEEAVRAMAYAGPCLLLRQGGERRLVQVESVTVSDATPGHKLVKHVTVTMAEVA